MSLREKIAMYVTQDEYDFDYFRENWKLLFLEPKLFFQDGRSYRDNFCRSFSGFLYILSFHIFGIFSLFYEKIGGVSLAAAAASIIGLLIWIACGTVILNHWGGWFFNLRLRWSGETKFKLNTALETESFRQKGYVVFSSTLYTYAVPSIILSLICFIFNQMNLEGLVFIPYVVLSAVFFVWDRYSTYRVVIVLYHVVNWRAFFYFIIVPLLPFLFTIVYLPLMIFLQK